MTKAAGFIWNLSTKQHVVFPLSTTNKIQRYTIFFIAVNARHVSGGFSAHQQELTLCIQHLQYVKLACCYRTANSPTLAVATSKLDIYQMLYVQFELLMMGGKPPETCRASIAINNIV
jgi:hypothetical protein